MPKVAKYSLNKFIVLWTALFLLLPCTTKQSIKVFLELPVSALYSGDQANKLRSCPETRSGSENQVAVYASEKQLKDLLPGHQAACPATYRENFLARLPDITNRHQAYTVPKYLLHERLLI